MRVSTSRNLSAIPTSLGWLGRHRYLVLGLALLWTGLMVLAPLAQIRAGLPDRMMFTAAINLAFTLPLDFYVLPMLLAFVDAEFNHHPANLLQDWRGNFEGRWLGAAAARALLYLAVSVGLALFVVPGLVCLLLLGWMPMYALVRGGTIFHAARWSAGIMAREWRRVLLGALPIFGIYLLLFLALDYAITRWGPDPSLWNRFRHPHYWLAYLASAVLNIWFSLAFLALFHEVENEAMLKREDPDQSRK